MKRYCALIAGLILLLTPALSGCNSASPEVAAPPENTSAPSLEAENPSGPYPAQGQAYPALESASITKEPFDFPEPVKGTATIHGRLVVIDPMYMLPKGNDSVYLVPMPQDGSVVSIPQFNPEEVPQAVVDEFDFEFMFTNIPVGQYAVVIITTNEIQTAARYYEKSGMVIIRITPEDLDKTMDLGYLQIP